MIRRTLLLALLGLTVLFGALATASREAMAAPYAAMVIDARTGEVLHSRNADTRLHPASLTKMMTLYIVFEAVRLGEITMDTQVRVSRNAAAEPPSRLGLQAGSNIRLRYLVRAAAVRSANDAATAMAEAIEGSEAAFARRMNRTAEALGMTRTTFRNAHGLTESGHMSTARDMTTMGRRIFFDYPQYYNLFSRRSTDAGIATVRNTNRRFLDAYRGADGIKTGYTRAAGFNLVSSAQRGNVRIIATVFGGSSSASRNQRIMELLDMGFARAPANAQIRQPDLPSYGTAGGVGRTTRTTGQVTSSLIPLMRPRPVAPEPDPDLLAAVDEAVGEALAEAVIDELSEVELPDEAVTQVVAEVAEEPVEDADTLVAAAEPAPRPEDATVTEIAETEEELPVTELAESEPTPEIETVAPIELAALIPDEPAIEPDQDGEIANAPDHRPAPRPEIDAVDSMELELAVIDPEPEMPEQEIVTRASSTGSRLYGVSLGRFPSRFAAEQELVRTVLAELGTFDTALRNVVNRTGGFEAQFAGMSQSEAERACSRLMSRNVTCTTYGP